MLAELREAVRVTALAMYQAGLVVGTDGNVSAKDPATGYVAITPSSLPYDQITADDIVIVDMHQAVVWGRRRPSWETPMHTYVHAHRPGPLAIMHTHSAYATAFALANRDLPPVTLMLAAIFGGPVRCAPYARTGSDEMGRVNMDYLGQTGKAVLLGNHGTLCVAPDLAQVVRQSIVLEDGARAAFQAAQLGPLVAIPPAEVAWLHDAENGFPAHHPLPAG